MDLSSERALAKKIINETTDFDTCICYKEKFTPSEYLLFCQMKLSSEQLIKFLDVLWRNFKTENERMQTAQYLNMQKGEKIARSFPFQASHSVIMFKVREPHVMEEKTISFRNIDKVPQILKMIKPISSHLTVINPVHYHQKVAPGMSVSFQLQFTPTLLEDCYFELHCLNDSNLLIIPVFAFIPRAILDFPNRIYFPPCAVKNSLTKTIMVRNIGERDARFTLKAFGSFAVEPNHECLCVNDIMQINIEFKPKKVGNFFEMLSLHYSSGEEVHITLSGSAENVNIRLEKNSIHLPSTYIGLITERHIQLFNNSDIISVFKWMTFSDELLHQYQCSNKEGNQSCPHIDPTFCNDIFEISPLEGELWPKSSQDFIITFKPHKDKKYSVTAFCDVAGKEMRIPLKMIGDGKGPEIVFLNDRLDVGKILMGSVHNYEVILKNLGEIPGTFRYRISQSLFGTNFRFIPETEMIPPHESMIVHITVVSSLLGTFLEEFYFEVEQNSQPLKLTITGSCSGPTISFAVKKLNFGNIAFAFPSVKFVDLRNESIIPAKFYLRLIEGTPEGGDKSKTDRKDFYSSSSIIGKCNEISVSPVTGQIHPQSSQSIKIELTAYHTKQYYFNLLVDIQGVGKAITYLSIIARSIIPRISLIEPSLNLERCFLNYPYEKKIHIKNEVGVPAIYHILTQSENARKLSGIAYEVMQPMGIIQPGKIVEVSVIIKPQRIGIDETCLPVTVSGDLNRVHAINITCTAFGPIINIQPEYMDWGGVPVLENLSKVLYLNNLSPIPASFTANMVSSNSVWKLDVAEGVIPAHSTKEIKVSAYFQDNIRFVDKININVIDGTNFNISISAKAQGSTIVVKPRMRNPLNIGAHFSKVPLYLKFFVSNLGKKNYTAYWTSEVIKTEEVKDSATTALTKSTVDIKQSVFHLNPAVMELNPNQTADLIIQAKTQRPQEVKELLSCYAVKGRSRNKELVLQTEIHAVFIAPTLEYSTHIMNFECFQEKDKDLQQQVQSLLMKNTTVLDLSVHLATSYPFYLVSEGNVKTEKTIVHISVGHTVGVMVVFDPNYVSDKYSRSIEKNLIVTFADHPQEDRITLKGDVYFPNLKFDSNDITFVNICNGIEARRYVNMINTSPLIVHYQWKIMIENWNQKKCLFRGPYDFSDWVTLLHEDETLTEISAIEEKEKLLHVLPIKGRIEKNNSQTAIFTFLAECNIGFEGFAVCIVDDGPTYYLNLQAQASEIGYRIWPTTFFLGNQVFNDIIEIKVNIQNIGDVNFYYSAEIRYHDDPVALKYEIKDSNEIECSMIESTSNRLFTDDDSYMMSELQIGIFSSVFPNKGFLTAHERNYLTIQLIPALPWKFHYQVAVTIDPFEKEIINIYGTGCYPSLDIRIDNRLSMGNKFIDTKIKYLKSSILNTLNNYFHQYEKEGPFSYPKQVELKKALVNCYKAFKKFETTVDFGYVILGSTSTKEINFINSPGLSVSFKFEHEKLAKYGFQVDCDQICALPPETGITIHLTFNPSKANIPEGEFHLKTEVKIINGPVTVLHLQSIVTKPKLQLSLNEMDFGEVQFNKCKIMTVQLYNNGFVPTHWEAHINEISKERKKTLYKWDSKTIRPVFKASPLKGCLEPDEKSNVEIHFIPADEKHYLASVLFILRNSSNIPKLSIEGKGVEPVLEIKNLLLYFDPILPYSDGDEKKIIISNPCSFPIEFYNIEFDKKYLFEDRIFRLLNNYDQFNSIFIPERQAGQQLPIQFYNFYTALLAKLEEFLDLCNEKWNVNSISQDSVMPDERGEHLSSTDVYVNGRNSFEESPINVALPDFSEAEKNLILKAIDILKNSNNEITSIVSKNFLHDDELEELFYIVLHYCKQDGVHMDIKNPATAAVDEYLKHIKDPERGIDRSIHSLIIIINGFPETDDYQNYFASYLSEHYYAKTLILDDVFKDAILSETIAAALVAREQCSLKTKPIISDAKKKTSDIDKQKPEFLFGIDEKEYRAVYLSPEIFQEMLNHRLKMADCFQGVIIKGLQTNFCATIPETMMNILKVVKHKENIYVITLHKDYMLMKQFSENEKQLAEELKQKNEELELQHIQDISEEEYDKLTDEKKEYVDRIIFKLKMDRKKKILEEKDDQTKTLRNNDKGKEDISAVGKKPVGKPRKEAEPPSILQIDEKEQLMINKFGEFQNSFLEVFFLLENWDRVKCECLKEWEPLGLKDKQVPGKKAKEISPINLIKEKMKHENADEISDIIKKEDFCIEGVPHFVFDLSKERSPELIFNILLSHLPSVDKLLQMLGLKSCELYCPPAYLLSIINYPQKTSHTSSQLFTFTDDVQLSSSIFEKEISHDTEVVIKETSSNLELENTSTVWPNYIPVSITGSVLNNDSYEDSNLINQSTKPLLTDEENFLCRWIIPPGKEMTLTLKFCSHKCGTFDHTLQLEILGSRKQYALYCRGICQWPDICREPSKIFPNVRKVKKEDQIVKQVYIENTKTFEFGPILYLGEQFQNNTFSISSKVQLFIINKSAMIVKILFSLLNLQDDVFNVVPNELLIKSNGKENLTVTASPKSAGFISDVIVCCIENNPKPFLIPVSFTGVVPEIEIDKKIINFERVLLRRRESASVILTNKSFVPLAWKIDGINSINDYEVTCPVTSGIVNPFQNEEIIVQIKSNLPAIITKHPININIYDANFLYGIIHSETLLINAEIYDILLDLGFPSGVEGVLNFGNVQIQEEAKLVVFLKNKGKYDVHYQFKIVKSKEFKLATLQKFFTIFPEEGKLSPTDKNITIITITCKCEHEIFINFQTIIKGYIMDVNSSGNNEIIAVIPIKVYVQSLYSSFKIIPETGVKFGPILLDGPHAIQTFVIENLGKFPFQYDLFELEESKKDDKNKGKPSKGDVQAKLILKHFTLSPSTGILPPDQSAIITVNGIINTPDLIQEEFLINISDRNLEEHPSPIKYSLQIEGCYPRFSTDLTVIFQEYPICSDFQSTLHVLQLDVNGCYCQQDNTFWFKDTLLHSLATAQFYILNDGKVPCTISTVFNLLRKQEGSPPSLSVFPEQATIMPNDFMTVIVKFSPVSMEVYAGFLLITVENNSFNFNICGQGMLPTIDILKPTTFNSERKPLMIFKQLFPGEQQELELHFKNNSTLPCMVSVELTDSNDVFSIAALPHTLPLIYGNELLDNKLNEKYDLEHSNIILLQTNDIALFTITFSPKEDIVYNGNITLCLSDNPYENIIIALVGEGIISDVILRTQNDVIYEEHVIKDEILQSVSEINAVRSNRIHFGECQLAKSYKSTVSVINLLNSTVRFQWPEHPAISFSPQIGHIWPQSNKDVTVTIQSAEPVSFNDHCLICDVCCIEILNPNISEDLSWDDRKKIVKWSTSSVHSTYVSEEQQSVEFIEKKSLVTEPEPEHQLILGTEKTLELYITAEVAACNFQIDKTDIFFDDVMMFESKTSLINITNSGLVSMDIKWTVIMEEPLNDISSKNWNDFMDDNKELVAKYSVFSISPVHAVIKSNQTVPFEVKFSPLDVAYYKGKLSSQIINLPEGIDPPEVFLTAKSLLPYCYFEIEDSSYLRSDRCNPALVAPAGFILDSQKVKVIEIFALGCGIKYLKSFNVLNPTINSYSFEWTRIDSNSNIDKITCKTPKGKLRSGMKTEMVFGFLGQAIGTEESFWYFTITELNISLPFMVVCHVKDPLVIPSRACIHIKPLLLNQTVEEKVYIMNYESVSLEFTIDPSSCFSEGKFAKVQIDPMTGIIPANSRIQLNINFQAKSSGEFDFHVLLKVERKNIPVKVLIKVHVFELTSLVFCEFGKDNRLEIIPYKSNVVELGQIEIGSNLHLSIIILNTGEAAFEFKWTVDSLFNVKKNVDLTINPMSGFITAKKTETCVLAITPKVACVVKDGLLRLQIVEGPVYSLLVCVTGLVPGVSFSSEIVNFGQCLVLASTSESYEQIVTISNTYNKTISIECMHISSIFAVHCPQGVLKPKESWDIKINFCPEASKVYKDVISFLINGFTEKTIKVFGEGVLIKLSVVDKIINMGSLMVGQTNKKRVTVLNHSKAPVSRSFTITSKLPVEILHESLSLSYAREPPMDALKGSCDIDVIFSPKRRMAHFQAEVIFTQRTTRIPVFIIQGSCKTLEVMLINDSVTFGVITKGSRSIRKILMYNSGDYGTKFHWDKDKFAPDFSIHPSSGYILPDSQINFTVTFHPTKISQLIRYEDIKCYLENNATLSLTLIGSCIDVPPALQTINFSTVVRKKANQQITINNDTFQEWLLYPIISGEHWSGPEMITVRPRSSNTMEITYFPTTTANQPHKGTVLIPLLEKNTLLYDLIGTADPPKPIATIQQEIQCRTDYVELLTFTNWFPTKHRFKVKTEMVRPDRLEPGILINHVEYVDIMANANYELKLSFYAFKETTVAFKVIFETEDTKDYEYYELIYKTYKAGPAGTIVLSTPLLTSVRYEIKLVNILQQEVMFSSFCNVADIAILTPDHIPPNSMIKVTLEYSPTKVGETQGYVELTSTELGVFHYDVHAVCTPPLPGRPVSIRTNIGIAKTATINFPELSPKSKIDFLLEVDHPDFTLNKPSLSVLPESHVNNFEVTFDPSTLGDISATITASSPLIGKITFPVNGQSLLPKPQGPIIIKAGSPNYITVRNPLSDEALFRFNVDNEQFSLKLTGDNIKSKKDIKVPITFHPSKEKNRKFVAGKFIVTAFTEDKIGKNLQWIFYLKGIL